MKKTDKLKLPIYNTPDVDIFQLDDWNEANKNLEKSYVEVLEFKEEIPRVNASAEVLEARVGEATLGKKINKIDSQLEHKANKNGIFSMANMGQDVKEAITGGSVGVVGVDSVLINNLHPNIADSICSYSDLSGLFIDGYYRNDLEFVSFLSWRCAMFDVVAGDKLKISGHNTNAGINLVSIVNAENKIIYSIPGGQSYDNFLFTVPINGRKIYISYERAVKFSLGKAEPFKIKDNLDSMVNDFIDLEKSFDYLANGTSLMNEEIRLMNKELSPMQLEESDLYSETTNFTFLNNGILGGNKKDDITNSHPFIYFKNGMNLITFEHCIDDQWIALGGDMLNVTGIGIGKPWSIRLIDLGATNGNAVDIDIEDKANIGDIILFSWENDILVAKKDKNDGNGFIDWFSVDLSLYTKLKHYKIKKRFGVINNRTDVATLIKNVKYSDSKNGSLIDRVVKLENSTSNNNELLFGKTWNAVGDSITQNNRYQPFVAEKTGVTPTSMKGLASSTIAINNSYLINKSVVERVCGLNGNQAYKDADIWTIFACVNDWLYGTPIGSIDNKDNTTFYGALIWICENILLRQNKPKLILFTPLQSNRNGISSKGISMAEYRKAIIEVGEYYSILVLDLYAVGGLNPINLSMYAPDGIHPNDEGTEIYAPKIVDEMKKLY